MQIKFLTDYDYQEIKIVIKNLDGIVNNNLGIKQDKGLCLWEKFLQFKNWKLFYV